MDHRQRDLFRDHRDRWQRLVTTRNEDARLILGWSDEEMLGQPADRFFTPEDRAQSRPAFKMKCALETGAGNDERWHLRKSGDWFRANGKMTVLRSDADEAMPVARPRRSLAR